MLKRSKFQPPPAAFPPVEEKILCPRCGFDHAGWAFEPGYEKRCVKCGELLEEGRESEAAGWEDLDRTGLFGRFFQGLFGRRKGIPERSEAGTATLPPSPAPTPQRSHRNLAPREAPASSHPSHPTPPATGPSTHPSDSIAPVPAEPSTGETAGPGGGLLKKVLDDVDRLRREGRYAEAIRVLEETVEPDALDAEAWGLLGRLHYEQGRDWERAVACCERALALDEGLVQVHCTRALAWLHAGRFQAARKGFLRALRIVQEGRGDHQRFALNRKLLLEDCLGELYTSRKTASGRLLRDLTEIIELLEIEKICFR